MTYIYDEITTVVLVEFDSIRELQPEFSPRPKIGWVICMKSPWAFALTARSGGLGGADQGESPLGLIELEEGQGVIALREDHHGSIYSGAWRPEVIQREIRNQKSDCDWNEPVYPGRYCSFTHSPNYVCSPH